jgi:hypothetical protein
MIYRYVDWNYLRSVAPCTAVDSLPLSETVFSIPPQEYILLRGATKYPRHWGIFFEDLYIFDEIAYAPNNWCEAPWMQQEGRRFDVEARTIHIKTDETAPEEVVSGPSVYVDSLFSTQNLGHMLHDFIPAFELIRGIASRVGRVKILLLDKYKYRNLAFLHHLLFGDFSDTVVLDEAVRYRFDELYILPRQALFDTGTLANDFSPTVRFNGDGLRLAIRTVADAIVPAALNINNIYVYRAPPGNANRGSVLQGRLFQNQADFSERLLSAGFLAVDPGRLNISQVFSLFLGARRIVGIHGAGLMNLAFARPGCDVFEIQPSTGVWRSIRYVAQALRMRHHEIQAAPGCDESAGQVLPDPANIPGLSE